MKKIFFSLLILIASFFFAHGAFAATKLNLPDRYGYVNDYSNIMSAKERESLEKELLAFSQKNNKNVYIAIINGLQGTTGKNYITQLFEKWRVGDEDMDSGSLILIAPYDRVILIENGYKLQNIIPNESIKTVIDEKFLPQFTKSNYDQGIKEGTKELLKLINGDIVYSNQKTYQVNLFIFLALSAFVIYVLYNVISHIIYKRRTKC